MTKPIKREDLKKVNGNFDSLPSSISPSMRLEYAWEIISSQNEKYAEAANNPLTNESKKSFKDCAFSYLRQNFKIPNNLSADETKQIVKELMPFKDRGPIPTYADIQPYNFRQDFLNAPGDILTNGIDFASNRMNLEQLEKLFTEFYKTPIGDEKNRQTLLTSIVHLKHTLELENDYREHEGRETNHHQIKTIFDNFGLDKKIAIYGVDDATIKAKKKSAESLFKNRTMPVLEQLQLLIPNSKIELSDKFISQFSADILRASSFLNNHEKVDQFISALSLEKISSRYKTNNLAKIFLIKHFGIPENLDSTQQTDYIKRILKQEQGLESGHMKEIFFPEVDRIPEIDNKPIDEINELVRNYNVTQDQSTSRDILRQINAKRIELEDKYNYFTDKTIGKAFETQIHHGLYTNILKQLETCGLSSMQELAGKDTSNPVRSAFVKLVDDLTPDKAKKLIELLGKKSNNQSTLTQELQSLTDKFNDFFQNNQIEFLGGRNSKNFKITPKEGNPFVLKLENRMGIPRTIEKQLRNRDALKPVFTEFDTARPVSMEVSVKYMDEDSNIEYIQQEIDVRSLVVTDFVSGCDLESDSKKIEGIEQRQQAAVKVYKQMAFILHDMEQAGCAFPDMKNTNWLIDNKNKVRLADTKSFIPAPNNLVDQLELKNNGYDLIRSHHMIPPEFKVQSFNTSKAHAFMLGKNLYQYLTQCHFSYLANKDNFHQDHFNHKIFASGMGIKLKKLIQNLVCTNPDDRLDIGGALSQLNEIQLTEAASNAREKLDKIKNLSFGNNDTHIKNMVEKYEGSISRCSKIEDLESINQELESYLKTIDNSKSNEIKELIKNFRRESSWYTIGMNRKADRIEQAMAGLSIEERQHPEKSKVVMQALASHRHTFTPGDVKLHPNGEVNEDNAAHSFHQFKDKLKKIEQNRPQEKDASEQEANNSLTANKNGPN